LNPHENKMGRSVNKVTLIGTLGRDPEVRYLPNGNAVANLSLATDESYNDKGTGQKVEQTEWHRITVYGRLAEICQQYLKKGARAYFEGKLRTREWEKDGGKRYVAMVWARLLAARVKWRTIWAVATSKHLPNMLRNKHRPNMLRSTHHNRHLFSSLPVAISKHPPNAQQHNLSKVGTVAIKVLLVGISSRVRPLNKHLRRSSRLVRHLCSNPNLVTTLMILTTISRSKPSLRLCIVKGSPCAALFMRPN
jgi:single stranded DNA-binding protein